MQPSHTDRRDATLYDIPWAGVMRRALVVPSPYASDMLAAFDAETGEFVLHASEAFLRCSAIHRGGLNRFEQYVA